MKNPLKLVIIILSSILAVTAAGTIFSIATRHKHEHTFGEWNFYTVGNLYCEQRLFYRICSTCGEFGWKKGSSQDHDWEITTTSPTC